MLPDEEALLIFKQFRVILHLRAATLSTSSGRPSPGLFPDAASLIASVSTTRTSTLLTSLWAVPLRLRSHR
jgi:hypothetical protein